MAALSFFRCIMQTESPQPPVFQNPPHPTTKRQRNEAILDGRQSQASLKKRRLSVVQQREASTSSSLLDRAYSYITGFFSSQNDGGPQSPNLSFREWIYEGHPLFTTPALTSLIASYLIGNDLAYPIDHVLDCDPEMTLSLCLSNKKRLVIQDVLALQQEQIFKETHELEFLKKCSDLEHVDLSGFNFFEEPPQFEDFCFPLKSVKFDQCSEEDLIHFVSHYPSLTSVDFANHFVHLTPFHLRDKTYLTKKKEISDLGLEVVAQCCPQLVTIKFPPFERNVTDASLDALGRHCHHLTSIDCNFSYTTVASVALLAQKCPSIRSICLQQVGGTDLELQELAQHSPHLTSIHLAYHELTNRRLENLAPFWPRLQAINLFGCSEVSDRGVRSLTQYCRELTSINLGHCAVSDEGIQAIIENCAPHITTLVLEGCREITNVAFKALFENFPLLATLDLGVTQVTDTEMHTLAKRCHSLTFINLHLCEVTEVGLEALVNGCPDLNEIIIMKFGTWNKTYDRNLRASSKGNFTMLD